MKRNDDVGDLAICILASEGGLNGGKRGFNQQKLGYKTSQGVDSGYIYNIKYSYCYRHYYCYYYLLILLL